MMQAARVHQYGTPDVIQIDSIPTPTPQPHEVLVQVRGTGVLPVDCAVRAGAFNGNRADAFPFILGSAYAGVITAVGSEVKGLREGQAVFGRTPNGATAEYTTVPVHVTPRMPYHLSAAIPLPENISFEQGATLSGGANTAWRVLFDAVNLQAGQRVLVQGAAGGVGAFAVQLARWKGAEVIGTTSTGNVNFVRGLGADTVIDYTTTPFEEVVRDVDVVFDTVGGDPLARSFGVLKRGGTLFSIVENPSTETAEVHGVHAAFFNTPPTIEVFESIFENLAALITEGKIMVPPPRLFALSKIAQAHALCETGHGRGRIVVQPNLP